MKQRPFRSRSGRFAPGVQLTSGDLRQLLIPTHEDDHVLVPSWLPLSFRVQARRVPELTAIYGLNARPTIRTALWAIANRRAPLGRLTPTCGEHRCVNPKHMEEYMSLSPEICHFFFTAAEEAVNAGRTFDLPFPTEGKAISYRHQLHRWRKENAEALSETINSLVLRIVKDADGKGIVLSTALDTDDVEFLSALQSTGIAIELPEGEPSAKELFLAQQKEESK